MKIDYQFYYFIKVLLNFFCHVFNTSFSAENILKLNLAFTFTQLLLLKIKNNNLNEI